LLLKKKVLVNTINRAPNPVKELESELAKENRTPKRTHVFFADLTYLTTLV